MVFVNYIFIIQFYEKKDHEGNKQRVAKRQTKAAVGLAM